jgi:hypothetical protein
MAEPKRERRHSSRDVVIAINADGTCPLTHVHPGDKLQWRAPANKSAWVGPPRGISGDCQTAISIPAGQTEPLSPAWLPANRAPTPTRADWENQGASTTQRTMTPLSWTPPRDLCSNPRVEPQNLLIHMGKLCLVQSLGEPRSA